jgi:hypothetical protein
MSIEGCSPEIRGWTDSTPQNSESGLFNGYLCSISELDVNHASGNWTKGHAYITGIGFGELGKRSGSRFVAERRQANLAEELLDVEFYGLIKVR